MKLHHVAQSRHIERPADGSILTNQLDLGGLSYDATAGIDPAYHASIDHAHTDWMKNGLPDPAPVGPYGPEPVIANHTPSDDQPDHVNVITPPTTKERAR